MEHDPSALMAIPRTVPYPFIRSLSEFLGIDHYNLMEVLSRMIYGSNMIALAGGSLPTTYRICCAVFEERAQIPEEFTKNDNEYEAIKQHLEFRGLAASDELIFQSYRETLQHAQAAKHLIQKVVLDRQAFDEATFMEAHRILTYKIDLDELMPWSNYSGTYCLWDTPRDMRFLDPAQIPTAMLQMINELMMEMTTMDMQQPRIEDVYERICYASRFCQRFILIRPFLDGNGRMYRLFLTTLLLRARICPAIYGLYAFDRFHHSRAEASCFRQDNQELLGAKDIVALETNHHLAKFVLEHTHGGWNSPDNYMKTFLQVTRRGQQGSSSSKMDSQ
ncbi:hypothetical protein FAGAP_6510 [Fusarium agapanthi]|uniref:Fido domain-containing protein n=1 Tax=Fusarium agapanthi TaxID=1803897 RepID=A0A9P5EDY2_9HYPO|nr:hypothetical protein FAGAP_6510 [Fusarium agapanthi]